MRDATTADQRSDIPEEKKKPFQAPNKNKQPQNTPMTSSQEPTNLSQNNAIDKPSNRFGFTEDKPIEKPLKEQCLYKSTKAKKLKEIDTKQQGTGQGTWGPTETSRGSVNTKREAVDKSFDAFVEAIAELNKQEDCIASIRTSTDQTEFIPLIKPGKHRQWSYYDSGLKSRRAVIIADIEYKTKHFCLIDFKFRENESYSRAIITRKDYLAPSNQSLYETFVRLAHARGRWGNITKLHESLCDPITTKHSEPNIQTFASKIEDKLLVITQK
jgi:hypothetical protein